MGVGVEGGARGWGRVWNPGRGVKKGIRVPPLLRVFFAQTGKFFYRPHPIH